MPLVISKLQGEHGIYYNFLTFVHAYIVNFLNKIFLDRCYNRIKESPTERLKTVYSQEKTKLEAEYFTVGPNTTPILAQQIEEQKKEWHSNARTLRNIKTSLYPYRHYFIPKDPVNVHDEVSCYIDSIFATISLTISIHSRINWTLIMNFSNFPMVTI